MTYRLFILFTIVFTFSAGSFAGPNGQQGAGGSAVVVDSKITLYELSGQPPNLVTIDLSSQKSDVFLGCLEHLTAFARSKGLEPYKEFLQMANTVCWGLQLRSNGDSAP